MKKWVVAEMVELNIDETANGKAPSYFEFDINGEGTNESLLSGPGGTPDTVS